MFIDHIYLLFLKFKVILIIVLSKLSLTIYYREINMQIEMINDQEYSREIFFIKNKYIY